MHTGQAHTSDTNPTGHAQEEPGVSKYRLPGEQVATIVIFGATGDLTARKLVPALYNLWRTQFLPRHLTIVGVARRPKSVNEFREDMCNALLAHSRTVDGQKAKCDPFVSEIFYYQLEFNSADGYTGLAAYLDELEQERSMPGHRLYYLATGPEFFGEIVERLGKAGLIFPPGEERYSRAVFEKPFGYDLPTAQDLNRHIQCHLAEDQIFRIDHYLGKETVQNIFAFRFGNAIFEPLFNQKYVDHVQITVSETVGMEGRRGAFYDRIGALRDVVQNHALQLMCLAAMEPPGAFQAKEIRDEKVKVLANVELPRTADPGTWVVRGQYTEGDGSRGYLYEEGVAEDSHTETYVAVRLAIDNWRWAGVPFMIRTGKRLKARVTEIAIQFKHAPTHYFEEIGVPLPVPNVLVFRIQPNEAITLTCNVKAPGMDFSLHPVDMDFSYGHFNTEMPDAYERLILDALRGDPTLFTRADEIENAWRICSDIMAHWQTSQPPELYRPGTWGPTATGRLFEHCEGCWRTPEP